MNFCGPESHLGISDLESPSYFQVKEKKIIEIGQEQRNCGLIKDAKNRHV